MVRVRKGGLERGWALQGLGDAAGPEAKHESQMPTSVRSS